MVSDLRRDLAVVLIQHREGEGMTRLEQFWRFLRGKPLVHCWADGPGDEIGSTCMRLWGHLGTHDFIPDGEIEVSFQGLEERHDD